MAFSINTNIASLQAQFYLNQTNIFQSKTINRVTSGLRIVNSGDDAAGLATANALRDTQAVLTQGVKNVMDAQAQLQTADIGINNIGHMLDRLNSLATSSNSTTLVGGNTTRATLQKEFNDVVNEIDRQANQIGLGTGAGGNGLLRMNNIYVGGSATQATSTLAIDLSGAGMGTAALGISAVQTVTGTVVLNSDPAVVTAVTGISSALFTFDDTGHSFGAAAVGVTVSLSGVTTMDSLLTSINSSLAQVGASNATFAAQHVSASIKAGKLVFSTSDGGAGLKVTGTAGGEKLLDAAAVNGAPGVGSVDISTQAAAIATIGVLTNAVNAMGTAQAAVGKGENVLAYSLTLANSQLTNMAASESQIRDADLAAEAANLSKAQVLTQAGVAALAQANSAPQAVLSLLKG